MSWKVTESWTGAVKSRAVGWRLTESWTGEIHSRSVSWYLAEEWIGTVRSRPVGWRLVETWTTTVRAPAAWYTAETWVATVRSKAVGWRLIESWSWKMDAPVPAPKLVTPPHLSGFTYTSIDFQWENLQAYDNFWLQVGMGPMGYHEENDNVGSEPSALVDGSARLGVVTGGSIENTKILDGVYENIAEDNVGAVYVYVTSENVWEGGADNLLRAQNSEGLFENVYENNYPLPPAALQLGENTTTVEVGSEVASDYDNLDADDENYYEVDSAASGSENIVQIIHESEPITTPKSWIDNIRVLLNLASENSANYTLQIYDWNVQEWDNLYTINVGATEENFDNVIITDIDNYISPSDNIRVRLVGENSTGTFRSREDYLLFEVNYTEPAYRENVQHNIAGVGDADTYTLEILYYLVGDSENIEVWLENRQNLGEWNLVGYLDNHAASASSPALFTHGLTGSDYLGAGPDNVRVRFVQPDNDSAQTSLMIDYTGVRCENNTATYSLRWEHRIPNVAYGYENYLVRIRGYISDNENVGVYIWKSATSEWIFLDNLDNTGPKLIEYSISGSEINDYLTDSSISILYRSADATDSTQTVLYVDLAVVCENVYGLQPPLVVDKFVFNPYTTEDMPGTGVYYWHVKQFRKSSGATISGQSEWSENWRFAVDITAPPIPNRVFPQPNQNVNNPSLTFTWEHSPDISLPIVYRAKVYVAAGKLKVRDSFDITENCWTLDGTGLDAPLDDGLYWWKIRATDNAGNPSNYSSLWKFRVDTMAPAAPQLIGPENRENLGSENLGDNRDNSPMLTWDPVTTENDGTPEEATPVMYYVSLSDDPSFSHENYSSSWIYDENWEVPELSEGVWYWRVMARDNAGNIGENSEPRWFRVDVTPPDHTTLISPDDGTKFNENQIQLRWAIVDNEMDGSSEPSLIVTYQVALNKFDDSFENENLSPWVPENTWTTWEVSDNVWYWRVRVRDNAGNISEWSDNQCFIVDTTPPTQPDPYEPENQSNTNENEPALRWHASFDLTNVHYRVWIASDPDFNVVVQDTKYTLTETFYKASYLPDNVYYWRVQARDEFNNLSENSDTMWFRLDTVKPDAPNPVWPVPEGGEGFAKIKENAPWFVWQVPEGEDSLPCTYWIEIIDEDNKIIRTYYWISGENWKYDNEFNPLSTYFWRVKAKDNAGNVGEFTSDIQIYTDSLPPLPTDLVAPIHRENINDNTPKLRWTAVINETTDPPSEELSTPIRYKLWVSLDNDFSPENIIHETPWTTDNFYQFTSELEDGKYYWKVGVKDAAENWPNETDPQTEGNIGDNSPTYWFRVDTLPPENVFLISPVDGLTVGDNTPALDWNPAVDNSLPVLYRVQVSRWTDFHENDALSQWMENDNWECTYLSDNDYYWRVYARDNAGNIYLTNYWRMRIDTLPPPVPELYYPYNNMTLSDNTPRLEWENVWDISRPVWHKVWVATDENFENIVAESPWLSSLDNADNETGRMYWVIDSTIYGDYLPDNTYYWRVTARDNAVPSKVADNTVTWTFRVDFTPPKTPALYQPENFDTENKNLQVDFEWENVTVDIDGKAEPIVIYLFQLARGGDWDNVRGGLLENFEQAMDNTYTHTFSDYGAYFWRVRPRDNAQPTPNWGKWSEIRRITIARWVAIDSWNVAVNSRPVSWNFTDSWSGTIKSRSVSWQIIEGWSGV
ncbi:MAG: hypothetical protein ACTSVD_03900, partial [Candidatus Thorarchaeota archaeon]